MTNELFSKNLILRPADPAILLDLAEAEHDPTEKARLNAIYNNCLAHPENANWYTIWKIFKRKTGEEVGMLQFCGLPQNGRVEVNCALSPVKDSEKIAAESLKRIAKWAFSQSKDLIFVSTWLDDDDSPAAQILENAGFGQTFEADGMVHYEMERPRISLLVVSMCFFTLLSFILGAIFGSYPLFVTIAIIFGIFPGHFLESKIEKLRAKKKQHPMNEQ